MILGHTGLANTPLNQIPKRLEVFEALIIAAEKENIFNLDNLTLKDAIKSQIQNLAIYDAQLQECKTIEYYLDSKQDGIEADLHKKYLEKSQRVLGARDIQMYIRGDSQLTEVIKVCHEVKHIKRQLESIVEALKALGWSLSNLVKIKIAQLDTAII